MTEEKDIQIKPFEFSSGPKKFWVVMLKDHTNMSLIEDENGTPTLEDVLELNKENEDDSVRNYSKDNYVISDESYTLKGCGEYMSKVITKDLNKIAEGGNPIIEDKKET